MKLSTLRTSFIKENVTETVMDYGCMGYTLLYLTPSLVIVIKISIHEFLFSVFLQA